MDFSRRRCYAAPMNPDLAWRLFAPPLPRAAGLAALETFRAADQKRRDAILWDVPAENKGELLRRAVAAAAEAVAFFDSHGSPLAFAWTAANGACPVAQVHFLTAGQIPDPLALVALYLRHTSFQGLLAAIPAPFRAAVNLAKAAGFAPVASIPKSAWLHAKNRAADLRILLWKK